MSSLNSLQVIPRRPFCYSLYIPVVVLLQSHTYSLHLESFLSQGQPRTSSLIHANLYPRPLKESTFPAPSEAATPSSSSRLLSTACLCLSLLQLSLPDLLLLTCIKHKASSNVKHTNVHTNNNKIQKLAINSGIISQWESQKNVRIHYTSLALLGNFLLMLEDLAIFLHPVGFFGLW